MAVDLSVSYRAPATARAMSEAAIKFLDSLNPIQRKAASFPFAGDERYTWNYRPTQGGDSRFLDRNGLRIISMTAEQQSLALSLIDASMSKRSAEQDDGDGFLDHGLSPSLVIGRGFGFRSRCRPCWRPN